MKKPNVLLIMTDQHRHDCVGCYGNEVIETPNLDWLASEGTVFENAYSATPSCIPARASLMTGQDQWNTGILGMGRGQGPMGVNFAHTLPGELAKGGYQTQGVGKMHFFPQRSLNGFHNILLDEAERVVDPNFVSDYKKWFEENKNGDYETTSHGIGSNSWMSRPYHAPEYLHPTNWTVNQSIEFIKRRDPSMPFFLKMSFDRPHAPYDPPSYFFDLYMKKEIPMPYIGDWATMHENNEGDIKIDAYRGKRSDEVIKRARAGYYGSITHIDHQIGRLFMFLAKKDLLKDTIIIFTSDHGDMLGDHNLYRKTYAYEGSTHIPMIVRLPESYGRVEKHSDAVVSLQDVMPTILEAVGLDIPNSVDGISMLGFMKGDESKKREYLHGEHSWCYFEEQEMQYLTDGNIKYIWFPRINTEQLFNLKNDKGECIDLSNDEKYHNTLLKWRMRLVRVLEKRNAGLTDGDNLVCQAGKPYLVSPKYQERLSSSEFDWMEFSKCLKQYRVLLQ